GRSGLAGPPPANPDAGPSRAGGARAQRSRSLCDAGSSQRRRQARGNRRRRIDDWSDRSGVRPRGETCESKLLRRSGPGTRAAKIRRAGGRTSVPQIFINGEHIGGSDELAALDRAGELDAKLGTEK